jgi:hypothetical protein
MTQRSSCSLCSVSVNAGFSLLRFRVSLVCSKSIIYCRWFDESSRVIGSLVASESEEQILGLQKSEEQRACLTKV